MHRIQLEAEVAQAINLINLGNIRVPAIDQIVIHLIDSFERATVHINALFSLVFQNI
jgi:hypothetical protein